MSTQKIGLMIHKIDWSFAGLIGTLLFLNYPVFESHFWFKHDTLFNFLFFYTFYNDLFLHHELLRWLPYGTYGIQADYWQIFCMSPASYFTAVLGWILRIRDVLPLFKISILIEQITLLTGTYLLAGKIFRTKTAVFFACLAMLGSTVWIYQAYWNMRVYYFLPLVFYFLILFFEREKLKYLWISGIVFFISLYGNIPYFLALEVPVILIFIGIFAWKYPSCVQTFKQFRAEWIWFAILLIISGTYLYGVLNFQNYISHFTAGRDPVTHGVPLSDFLTYGPKASLYNYLGLIFPTMGDERDHTVYIGIISLIFLIYAALNAKGTPIVTALSLMALFVFMLSLADTTFFARMIYQFFPPMRFFRYLAETGGLFRFFLVLLASVGVDQFFIDHQEKTKRGLNPERAWVICAIFVLVTIGVLRWVNGDGKYFKEMWPDFYTFTFILLLFTILLFLNQKGFKTKRAALIIISLLAIDLFSYQNLIFANWPGKHPEVDPKVGYVHAEPFQATRLLQFEQHEDPRVRDAFKLLEGRVNFYVEVYSFVQFDPCISLDPMVYEPEGVLNLTRNMLSLDIPVGSHLLTMTNFRDHPKTPSFLRTIGCGLPKLRLTSNVLFANDFEQEKKLTAEIPNLDTHIVLNGAPSKMVSTYPASYQTDEILGALTVGEFSPNRFRVEADIKVKEGAFLYYADSFHPGWSAWVDRKRADVLRANRAFKAVYVPAGKHTVEFKFFDGLQSSVCFLMMAVGISFTLIVFKRFSQLLVQPKFE